MRITIDGIEMFGRRYDTYDDMIDDYVEAADEDNRAVPSHAVDMILFEMAMWMLGIATQEMLGYLRRRREASRSQGEVNADVNEPGPEQDSSLMQVDIEAIAGEVSDERDLVQILRNVQPQVNIELQTEAESDLLESFKRVLNDLQHAQITIRIQDGADGTND